jgi:hypothetical protein
MSHVSHRRAFNKVGRTREGERVGLKVIYMPLQKALLSAKGKKCLRPLIYIV